MSKAALKGSGSLSCVWERHLLAAAPVNHIALFAQHPGAVFLRGGPLVMCNGFPATLAGAVQVEECLVWESF